jgi:hypothetical protein
MMVGHPANVCGEGNAKQQHFGKGAENLRVIDRLYPELRIDFVAVKGDFGPPLIESLAAHLGVPENYMFIGTPGDRFPHRSSALGGVRLIL